MGIVVRVVGAALALVALVGMGRPARAQDDDGLREAATTTWSIQPGAGRATASIELSLRNTVPDTSEGRAYFDGYGIALPMPPTDVTVRTGDRRVAVDMTTFDDATPGIRWDFPDRLYHDQTQTWQVDVTFASTPPRSDFDQGPRVTPAFVLVPIWAWGPDDATLVVRVPTPLDARLGFADPDAVVAGQHVFRRRDATGFSEFLVGASDDGQRTSTTVDVDGTDVVVESWPDDPAWGERMAEFAARALPELAAWTATPRDRDTLTIRETARPVAEGWGGWNDPAANEVSVGEDFDDALWTHELAHDWIDRAQFADDWLLEGTTEAITGLLADDLGIASPPVPRVTDRPLAQWDEILADADPALVADPDAWYATTRELYAGAHFVVGSVADEVGEEAFREMIRMTLADESAWGDLGRTTPDHAADWREFLDLAERVGGSTRAADLVLERVRPGAGRALARRDAAIERFDDVDDDPWGVPTDIAAAMHRWRFAEAVAAIDEAVAVRTHIDALDDRATARGLSGPDLRSAWRTGEMEVVEARLATFAAVLDVVAGLDDEVDRAGLPTPTLGLDPATEDPARTTRRVAMLRSSLDRLVASQRRLDAVEGDSVASLGLAGVDQQALRDRAQEAFARGDVDEVVAATDAIDDVVGGAGIRGRSLLWAITAAAIVVVVLLLAVGVTWRRRRRRRGRGRVLTEST